MTAHRVIWGVREDFTGGPKSDFLNGGPEDDTLNGGPGNDTLHGGAGDDTLYGGAGDDKLHGHNYDEEGTGDDRLYGGEDDDYLEGGGGADLLDGGPGFDYLDGGDDDDDLDGGPGGDVLIGRGGDDDLDGGEGNDDLQGRRGDDDLDGGPGNDYLDAGDDDDALDGGPGVDHYNGGAGADTFLFAPGDSTDPRGDVIMDFAPDAGDKIVLSGFSSNKLTRENKGDDQIITLPDGGKITLEGFGDKAFGIEGFTFSNPANEEQEAEQSLTLFEQHLRLANTPIESGGANDGGRARRQKQLNEGETGIVDAGDLDGLTLPEGAGDAYTGRYGLYWNPGDGGSYQLRFDDATTGALTPSATAAAIDAALEALDGITDAEVTGTPGDWTLSITATEGHLLQAVDVVAGVFFDGDLQLNYMGA